MLLYLLPGFFFMHFVQCGHYCTYSNICYQIKYYSCGFLAWGRCQTSTAYTCYNTDCCQGWRGGDCNEPICTSPCNNGGTCIAPDQCQCLPSYSRDKYCTTSAVKCSGKAPCYPGTCIPPQNCACFHGFTDPGSGCLKFSDDNNPPVIQECETVLDLDDLPETAHLFSIQCSDDTRNNMIWTNLRKFNTITLSMTSYYPPLFYLPQPPSYVTKHAFGVVYSAIQIMHSKVSGGSIMKKANDSLYVCPGFSSDHPKEQPAPCRKEERNYKYSLQHNDILKVTYTAKSGGFRQLYLEDTRQYLPNQPFTGQTTQSAIEIRFDFETPVHCSEKNTTPHCLSGQEALRIDKDITQSPIQMSWDGWKDELSGVASYYVEIFRLQPNINGELTEVNPRDPVYNLAIHQTTNIRFPSYIPDEPGMYSVLLRVSDRANNSKIVRRLVLFDDTSNITIAKQRFQASKEINMSSVAIGDGCMHVVSAIPDTGYIWQTAKNDSKAKIVLDWRNHFKNIFLTEEKLLNKVLPYPTQFSDLESSGVLRSTKYVSLDDNEGQRTVQPIANVNGVVKFEINIVHNDMRKTGPNIQPHSFTNDPVKVSNWTLLPGLSESFEFEMAVDDGSHVRMWVRATDALNNTGVDYADVHIDNSPPRLDGSIDWDGNWKNGTFNHTMRIQFLASDDGSGVHQIEYDIYIGDSKDKHETGRVQANTDNTPNACIANPKCNCILDTCFLTNQVLDIDNCMFLVPTEDLEKSGRVDVKVYNQAMLYEKFYINVSRLSDLDGLESYSGPSNIRVEKNLANGVRLKWDLPETASCYGKADIILILEDSSGTVRTIPLLPEETSVDLVGLDLEHDYSVSLKLNYKSVNFATAQHYSFQTAADESGVGLGVVVGTAVGVLVTAGLALAIFIILLRKGHMAPVRRGLTAVSVGYRKSVAGIINRRINNDHAHDMRDSIYMYGEMEFKGQSWQLSRNDIVLQSLWKTGCFANIYLATLQSSDKTVVAKTLKEGYTKDEELLMKSKINFSATVVGDHVNVLRFIGAVCEDSDFGPCIIYEYCSKGPLKDFLESMRNSVTLETVERLFRFGIGVAKGMEYLADRKIVHRRLAARNVLLNEQLVVKIAGFGPQPDQNMDKNEKKEKKERVPLKWTAPECLRSTAGATEKSDVWSFGIVLWEIFSLGEKPYNDIKAQDLSRRLKSGYRLPKPEQCDDKWYGVMKKAWEQAPENRPTFQQIREELDEAFVDTSVSREDYYIYQQ